MLGARLVEFATHEEVFEKLANVVVVALREKKTGVVELASDGGVERTSEDGIPVNPLGDGVVWVIDAEPGRTPLVPFPLVKSGCG